MCGLKSRGRGLTSEDGDDGFVDGRDLFHLHQVAGEEGDDEQHDGDEERPCCEKFLLGGVALCETWSAWPAWRKPRE